MVSVYYLNVGNALRK